MTLGATLKTIRGGRPQDEIAKAAEVSQSYLSELERDAKHPTLRALMRIAQAAGASPETIAHLEALWRAEELAGLRTTDESGVEVAA